MESVERRYWPTTVLGRLVILVAFALLFAAAFLLVQHVRALVLEQRTVAMLKSPNSPIYHDDATARDIRGAVPRLLQEHARLMTGKPVSLDHLNDRISTWNAIQLAWRVTRDERIAEYYNQRVLSAPNRLSETEVLRLD